MVRIRLGGLCTAYPQKPIGWVDCRTSDSQSVAANRKERNGQSVCEKKRKRIKKHGQTLSGCRKRSDKRTCEYRTENNKCDYGLERNGENVLLVLRRVLRRFEAALRESRNEDGAYPDLEKAELEVNLVCTLEDTDGTEMSTEECLAPIRDFG